MIEVKPANVPEELRDLPQWVMWKAETRNGKVTKLPYTIEQTFAKSNDSATWTTFNEAVRCHALGWSSGIGFVFSESDPFAGIDLDRCRNAETGAVAPWAKSIIQDFGSYAEVSPSGTGVKIFVKARMPEGASGRKVKIDAKKVCDDPPAVEAYDRLRYFAVTGQRLRGSHNVEERQTQFDAFLAKYMPAQETAALSLPDFHNNGAIYERARKYLAKIPPAISGADGHGWTFKAACRLVNGFELPAHDAVNLLLEWNQNCQPPWSVREIEHKIADALKAPGPRGYLKFVPENRLSAVSVPDDKEPEKPKQAKLVTAVEASENYLWQLAHGGTALTPLGLPHLDYAIGGGVAEGEMVIFAGRPSHNKSGTALQIAHNITLAGMPALFISEEMSTLALAKRTVQFATGIWECNWMTEQERVEADVRKHFEARAPLYFAESLREAQAVSDLIERAVAENGVKLVVIDYAQLLGGKGRSEYEQLSNVSRVMRAAANKSKVILIVLCQLSREIEKRDKYAPKMTDLRGTGQLEQDADVIVFLVWPHRLNEKYPKNEFKFYVAKNRNREIVRSVITCEFEPCRARLSELSNI